MRPRILLRSCVNLVLSAPTVQDTEKIVILTTIIIIFIFCKKKAYGRLIHHAYIVFTHKKPSKVVLKKSVFLP